MSRRLQENIVILLLLAFFVAILVVSLGYGPRTRLVPVPISILAIVLILFQLVWQNFRTADDLSIDLLAVLTGRGDAPDAKGADAAPQQTGAGPSAEWQRIAIAFGMIALFMAMILADRPDTVDLSVYGSLLRAERALPTGQGNVLRRALHDRDLPRVRPDPAGPTLQRLSGAGGGVPSSVGQWRLMGGQRGVNKQKRRIKRRKDR